MTIRELRALLERAEALCGPDAVVVIDDCGDLCTPVEAAVDVANGRLRLTLASCVECDASGLVG